MWDRIEQGLLAAVAVAVPKTDQHRPVAGWIELDVTGPARGARRNGQVPCGTAQLHEDMMIVGIDHRGATVEVGKDRDTVFDRTKPPGLGVVPVRGQGRVMDQIAGLRCRGRDPAQLGNRGLVVSHRPHAVLVRPGRTARSHCGRAGSQQKIPFRT